MRSNIGICWRFFWAGNSNFDRPGFLPSFLRCLFSVCRFCDVSSPFATPHRSSFFTGLWTREWCFWCIFYYSRPPPGPSSFWKYRSSVRSHCGICRKWFRTFLPLYISGFHSIASHTFPFIGVSLNSQYRCTLPINIRIAFYAMSWQSPILFSRPFFGCLHYTLLFSDFMTRTIE